MKQSTVLAVILAVLVVFSAVQAYQVTALKSQLQDAKLSLGTSSSSLRVKQTTSPALTQSAANLPAMVGGC